MTLAHYLGKVSMYYIKCFVENAEIAHSTSLIGQFTKVLCLGRVLWYTLKYLCEKFA